MGSSTTPVPEPEVDQLRAENDHLRRDIEAWKVKLTQAEVAHGKQPIFCAKGTTMAGIKGDSASGTAVAAGSSSEPNDAPKPEEKKKEKKEAKKKEEPKKDAAGAAGDGPVDVGRLDMRVGHIRSAKKHPDADALYVEEVNCVLNVRILNFLSFF